MSNAISDHYHLPGSAPNHHQDHDFAPGNNWVNLRCNGKNFYAPELFYKSPFINEIIPLRIKDIVNSADLAKIYNYYVSMLMRQNIILVNNYPVRYVSVTARIIGQYVKVFDYNQRQQYVDDDDGDVGENMGRAGRVNDNKAQRRYWENNFDEQSERENLYFVYLCDSSGSVLTCVVPEYKFIECGLSTREGNNDGALVRVIGTIKYYIHMNFADKKRQKELHPLEIEIVAKKTTKSMLIELNEWKRTIEFREKYLIEPWIIEDLPELDRRNEVYIDINNLSIKNNVLVAKSDKFHEQQREAPKNQDTVNNQQKASFQVCESEIMNIVTDSIYIHKERQFRKEHAPYDTVNKNLFGYAESILLDDSSSEPEIIEITSDHENVDAIGQDLRKTVSNKSENRVDNTQYFIEQAFSKYREDAGCGDSEKSGSSSNLPSPKGLSHENLNFDNIPRESVVTALRPFVAEMGHDKNSVRHESVLLPTTQPCNFVSSPRDSLKTLKVLKIDNDETNFVELSDSEGDSRSDIMVSCSHSVLEQDGTSTSIILNDPSADNSPKQPSTFIILESLFALSALTITELSEVLQFQNLTDILSSNVQLAKLVIFDKNDIVCKLNYAVEFVKLFIGWKRFGSKSAGGIKRDGPKAKDEDNWETDDDKKIGSLIGKRSVDLKEIYRDLVVSNFLSLMVLKYYFVIQYAFTDGPHIISAVSASNKHSDTLAKKLKTVLVNSDDFLQYFLKLPRDYYRRYHLHDQGSSFVKYLNGISSADILRLVKSRTFNMYKSKLFHNVRHEFTDKQLIKGYKIENHKRVESYSRFSSHYRSGVQLQSIFINFDRISGINSFLIKEIKHYTKKHYTNYFEQLSGFIDYMAKYRRRGARTGHIGESEETGSRGEQQFRLRKLLFANKVKSKVALFSEKNYVSVQEFKERIQSHYKISFDLNIEPYYKSEHDDVNFGFLSDNACYILDKLVDNIINSTNVVTMHEEQLIVLFFKKKAMVLNQQRLRQINQNSHNHWFGNSDKERGCQTKQRSSPISYKDIMESIGFEKLQWERDSNGNWIMKI